MDLGQLVIVVLSLLATRAAVVGLERGERQLALVSYGLHAVASVAQWGLATYYYHGVADAYGYLSAGTELARLLDYDPLRYGVEIFKLSMHLPANLPYETIAGGTDTTTAVAAVLVYLHGPSLLSLCLVAAWLSWFGQLCLYRVARDELEADDRTAALFGFMFVPSVVFWGSGYTKEALVLAALGVLCLSAYRLRKSRSLWYLPGIVFGAVGVGTVKAYTLFPLALGSAVYLYADKSVRQTRRLLIRPVSLIVAAAVAIGSIAALGAVFPDYSPTKVGESVATQQALWHQAEAGGSDIQIGDSGERTLGGQMRFVPLGLLNALFRPTILDVNNAPSAGAAFENSIVLLALLSLLMPRSRAVASKVVLRSPFLLGSLVFVIVFSAAVGIATSNLGSLSRYRVPMLPFWVTGLLVVRRHVRYGARSDESSAASFATPQSKSA